MSHLETAAAIAHLLEYNPYHGEDGRFTTSDDAQTIVGAPSQGALDIARATIANTGASVRLEGGVAKAPTRGYMVGVKGHGEVVPSGRGERALARDIDRYAANQAGALAPRGRHVGTWDTGKKVYLDASQNMRRRPKARAIAHETGELAIWDVVRGRRDPDHGTIPTQGGKAARQARAYRRQKKGHKRKMKKLARRQRNQESLMVRLASLAAELGAV